jgi:hypothetical protein
MNASNLLVKVASAAAVVSEFLTPSESMHTQNPNDNMF